MLIATAIPGCSYTGGVYTISISAINTVLGTDWDTANDSFERLLMALCMCLYTKQVAGTITQTNCGAEIAQKSISTGVWENPANTFTDVTLSSHLLCFNLGSTAFTEDPDTVTSI
jgi:hypothetical protein